MGEKKCNKCGSELPLIMFNSDKTRKDGLNYICKNCSKLESKKSYLKNKERINEKRRLARKENPEKHLVQARKYYGKYTERRKAYYEKYSAENSEKLKQKGIKYYENNRETIAEKAKNKRLKNIDEYSARSKNYRKRNKEKVKEQGRKYYEKNKDKIDEKSKMWSLSNPEKIIAHSKLNIAVNSGKIIKPKICDVCCAYSKKIQGHHWDYSKPLDVVWVCISCHRDIHNGVTKVAEEKRKIVAHKISEIKNQTGEI